MSFEPAIKWSGSKRSQASKIIQHMPKEIDTLYEPFCGGCNVSFRAVHSDIKINKIICSDINKDLIDLWNEIKNNPTKLLEDYTKMWIELNKDDDGERRKSYYNFIRDRFNQKRNPSDFMFINRTTTNGLIRYNSKGDFNNSFHYSRKGMHPDNLTKIIMYWNKIINEYNFEFIHQSYSEITTSENDFIYIDPPYARTKGMYYGVIDYEELWEWLRKQKSGYLLSFDGKQGDLDYTYDVPKDLYDNHIYINSGVSSFKRLKEQTVQEVFESLYIRKK